MVNVLKRNNVRVIGQGAQTLLFVNGFGCDQSIWRYILPAFSAQYQLVLFDHVGAGLSDTTAYDPKKYASLEGYAQDVLDICHQLQLEQTILVGHSVGAMIGVLAAIQEPEAFERLLLLCPSPCYLNEEGYHGGFERQDIEDMLAFMEKDYVGWADSFVPFIMGNPDRPSLTVEMTHSFCQNDPAIARQFARVTFLSDNRPDVARLRVPCLLVQCAQDFVAPQEVGEYLRATIPDSTLVTLPVSGHCPHVSAPTETLDAMEHFMVA
ncbi:sigma-B regulation protein RsbQ [Hymenobacter luteus]|uniref:Sigma-B regulation protein RsbQ n=2 Tax=Hymenobacter TaxID=89966 RepID=A0A7W9T034_9BACT|nr:MULTISPECIES: alpha/beta hydrolase [Hymenobacter]MBB4600676.1 sigma-B regulation protein RsbQ [Hymenobacter latericoloratus]MBB6059117.1 sigma-B regulation protein RsbQ [Hymenobacter luteus]